MYVQVYHHYFEKTGTSWVDVQREKSEITADRASFRFVMQYSCFPVECFLFFSNVQERDAVFLWVAGHILSLLSFLVA